MSVSSFSEVFCGRCNLITESQSILDISLRIGESHKGKVDVGIGHVWGIRCGANSGTK